MFGRLTLGFSSGHDLRDLRSEREKKTFGPVLKALILLGWARCLAEGGTRWAVGRCFLREQWSTDLRSGNGCRVAKPTNAHQK